MSQRTVRLMVRFLAVLALSGLAMAQSPAVSPNPPSSAAAIPPAQNPAAAAVMGKLPPLPKGKSTVIGGRIQNINPVLDQLTLKIFGGKTMKILFDERTQVFRNGVRIPVLDLHPAQHASVETTLDGSRVFALRIHMLSTLPQGQTEGQVVSYDPGSGRLTLNASLSQQSIVLDVPASTPVTRVGETSFARHSSTADLSPGALVRVTFTASGTGHAVATHIDVLATSGAVFTFAGSLQFLDIANGQMTILDPRDHNLYQVSFDPSQFAATGRLHIGSHLRVTATFDGREYQATSINIE